MVSAQGSKQAGVEELRHRIRHSASHIMADAVLTFFPEAKLTLGPPTDTGFYYDIDLPRPLTPEDLERIEIKMREIIARNTPFVEREIDRDEARRQFRDNPYKLEIIESIPQGERITTYSHGTFMDLCEGPHVRATKDVSVIKLLNVAGSYWRGDEKRPALQRIYGTAFESQEALDEHMAMREEAARRDHRKLGRELDLFMFDPLAPASPFFLPKGTVIYNLLIEYIRELYRRHGYQEVISPQIFSAELWKQSGHYFNYKENMYFFEVDEHEYGVKPMNCPGHILMYKSRLHSYRDLPIRYADFSRLHRYERSGVTHGLTRVRGFSQDDAHIFCREDQVPAEVAGFVKMLTETYRLFGFDDVEVRLSRKPEKSVGTEQQWERAEAILEGSLRDQGLAFVDMPGEGAFYGPKIDFVVKDALKREWQLGTAQLDFQLPERFGMEYITSESGNARPVMIHRALLGSVERFMGILIEHTAGAFPLWLAPVQAMLIPIADRHSVYAQKVAGRLNAAGLRAEVDGRSERMNLKVRDAQKQKVPYMLVVGDREEADDKVSVRVRSGENRGAEAVEAIIAEMKDLASSRS